MRLLIFRHAKAEKGVPGMLDRDRPLNPRGVKDALRMGAYLARHALEPDLALVSPARTKLPVGSARHPLPWWRPT